VKCKRREAAIQRFLGPAMPYGHWSVAIGSGSRPIPPAGSEWMDGSV